MDILANILFWLHLIGLGLGAVASFGIPVVGRQMATATPESRPALVGVTMGLSRVGQMGLGTLIVTGPLVFWLKWNFSAPSMIWFGIKMVLVVILIVIVAYAGMNGRKIVQGDREAIARAPQIGMAGLVVLLAVMFSAVFAFE
jgi:hypothetical protein